MGKGDEKRSDRSVGSDGSDGLRESQGTGGLEEPPGPKRGAFLRPSGGYRSLRSFQVCTIIYDATVSFCERFVDRRSRTVDQMVQAARSGRQNIAEGSRASAVSSQTELRLVNVARASLDELLLDYEDFLRQRGKKQWRKDDPNALAVRALGREHRARPGGQQQRVGQPGGPDQTDRSDPTDLSDIFFPYTPWLTHADPAVVANTIICLIHQANYLLDRQIAGLERQFIQDGGYTERLAAARIAQRNQAPGEQHGPVCPQCGMDMALRTARKGPYAGSQFWGCTGYPECNGTRRLEE